MREHIISSLRAFLCATTASLGAAGLAGCQGEDQPVRGAGSIHVARPTKSIVPEHLNKRLKYSAGPPSVSR